MWGKIIGGMAGFAMGGPFGAVVGAALGHAADNGGAVGFGWSMRDGISAARGGLFTSADSTARIADAIGGKEQVFAICVVVLAAKLAKCDGPVKRTEIDAFKRSFRIPPEALNGIGLLFDRARDSSEGFEPYARQLGERFADNRGLLEEVLTALFAIAAADGPPNTTEQQFLMTACHRFGLNRDAWERASGARPRRVWSSDESDPYEALGQKRTATNDELRTAWKQLMRENHPDGLAARGVPPDMIARASAKVANINAAWDRIKRERGL